jgi:single-strand DNA-binding protein
MSGLNKVMLIGRLTKDIEVRSVSSGSKVGSFTLAINETTKDKAGNKKETTEYVQCVCWNGIAELIDRNLKKGAQVYIEGKLRSRSWEKDGQKHITTECQVSNLVMLGTAPPRNAERATTEPNDNFWNR